MGMGLSVELGIELWEWGSGVEWEFGKLGMCVCIPQVCVFHFWRPSDSQISLTSSE